MFPATAQTTIVLFTLSTVLTRERWEKANPVWRRVDSQVLPKYTARPGQRRVERAEFFPNDRVRIEYANGTIEEWSFAEQVRQCRCL